MIEVLNKTTFAFWIWIFFVFQNSEKVKFANGSAGSPIIDGSRTAKPTLHAIVPRITTGKMYSIILLLFFLF